MLVNNLVDQKAKLSQAKQILLERRLHGRLEAGPVIAIPKLSQASADLSFSQQRLWFLQQLSTDNVAYHVPTALVLKGQLHIPALECAINAIIRRHEILRTRFEVDDGRVVQIIVPELHLPVPVEELTHVPRADREAEITRLAREESATPFELSRGPLLRVKLLHLAEQEYVLLFTLHHIVFDGWSAAILFEEFAASYRAFLQAEASPLPSLPIQYADFAHWQRQWLQGERLEKQLAYWRKQLEGVPALLELPTDHPRPPVQGGRGATHSFFIPKDLTERLRRLSRQQGVTFFVTLVSAFNVLLHRYSGQSGFCLGVSVANRSRPELEALIGLFANMLVLRADLSGDPGFTEFLQRMHAVSLGAQEHQDLPFEKLVEELNPTRDRSYSPYFQVIFILHNMPVGKWEVPGLTVRSMAVDFGTAKSDLALHVIEKDGIEATFEYSTDLFEKATIERMAGHFRILLEAIGENPEARVGDLPLLTPDESRQLVEWSAAGGSVPTHGLLHERFEALARRQPGSPAVICGGHELSYGELNERADRLARRLIAYGVGLEDRVGLCIERSVEAIIALLGILKAGAAYVPLDPSYPVERCAELLADCQAALLLTQERLAASFTLLEIPVLRLDGAEDTKPLAANSSRCPTTVSSHQAAYHIYTSGSTGTPKGVVVSHANAVASTAARFGYYAKQPEGFLLLSSLAFDSSVAGIFWTLSQGGRLCVPLEGSHQDPQAIMELVGRERPSHLLCLPSLYGLLLDFAKRGQMDCLRSVIVAGETCPPALAARHFDRLPWARLDNEYGPTEGTVWSTAYQIRFSDHLADEPIAIGRPVAHVRLYILDTRLNPVPVGVPGEIYLGGAGVARGYHWRPGLTAERFLPDPFSAPEAGRLYRTGDSARWRSGGIVEFLGRVDDQVKIRGFRIELGEIEARLLRHFRVKEAAVIVRTDPPGDKRVVAYVVYADGEDGSETRTIPETLRDFLKETLPDYMIPSAFVPLERLPVTLTGKVDRNVLPAPDLVGQFAYRYVAPESLLEEQVASIWAELLGVERIGIHDNFFDLGGHSLSAIQVIVRIQDCLGIDISVAELFDAPTVSEFARTLARQGERETDDVKSILRELEKLPESEVQRLMENL